MAISIVTAKHRHLTVTLAYSGIIGFGKVRYHLVCTSAARHFQAPDKSTVRLLAHQWGLEDFTENARSNHRVGNAQTLEIECVLLAGSSREARTQFANALLNKFRF